MKWKGLGVLTVIVWLVYAVIKILVNLYYPLTAGQTAAQAVAIDGSGYINNEVFVGAVNNMFIIPIIITAIIILVLLLRIKKELKNQEVKK